MLGIVPKIYQLSVFLNVTFFFFKQMKTFIHIFAFLSFFYGEYAFKLCFYATLSAHHQMHKFDLKYTKKFIVLILIMYFFNISNFLAKRITVVFWFYIIIIMNKNKGEYKYGSYFFVLVPFPLSII